MLRGMLKIMKIYKKEHMKLKRRTLSKVKFQPEADELMKIRC
jgi:hypothetical protein